MYTFMQTNISIMHNAHRICIRKVNTWPSHYIMLLRAGMSDRFLICELFKAPHHILRIHSEICEYICTLKMTCAIFVHPIRSSVYICCALCNDVFLNKRMWIKKCTPYSNIFIFAAKGVRYVRT